VIVVSKANLKKAWGRRRNALMDQHASEDSKWTEIHAGRLRE
jgi:hypothetical protein